ncbi:MAG: multidrug effflux MFS transporter [Parvibaculaceae bacterium]|nr:multidrug effflux MFS transporter [Parvibaculaceae bacterium]
MSTKYFDGSKASYLRLTLILGTLTAFAPFSIDMYLPAFPAIAAAYHATPGEVQTTLAAFFAGLSIGQLVIGPLSDKFGRLTPLVTGIVLYIAASVAATFAPTIGMLAVIRFFQALGGCAGLVTSRAMVRDLFNEQDSARTFSLLMLVMGVAPILAPVTGTAILEATSWRSLFWMLAGFGMLCLVMVTLWLGETLPRTKRTKGGIGDTLWYVFEAYLSLLRNRGFLAYASSSAFLSAGLFAYITGAPFVFIEHYGLSPIGFAVLFSTNAAGLIAASQINGFLLRTYRSRAILRISIRASLAAALLLVVMAATGWGGMWGVALPLFAFLSTIGFVGANAMAAAMATAGSYVGPAAALSGVLPFALAACTSSLVGALGSVSALPMTLVIVLAAILAFTAHSLAPRLES